MAILSSLSGVFCCMIMIILGYYLSKIKWFDGDTSRLFSKMAMFIAIPTYMLWNMMKSYTKADLIQLGYVMLVPAILQLTCFLIGVITSYALRIPIHRRGAYRSMAFVSNSAFIGFPVVIALFGDKALPIALTFWLVQTISFWTIGAYSLSKDGEKMFEMDGANKGKTYQTFSIFSLQTVKHIISFPLIAAFLAVVLILAKVKLPIFLMSTCQYLGNMTTPLTMLFIGIGIYLVDFKTIRFDRDMFAILGSRFLIAPIVVLITIHFIPVPPLVKSVFLIQASMPVMTQISVAAKAFKADSGYVAVNTAVTTICGLFTIPIYYILLTMHVV
jgi:malate permease and related proteins